MIMPETDQNANRERLSGSLEEPMPSAIARFFSRRLIVMLAIVAAALVVVFGIIIGKGLIVANYMKNMVQTTVVSTVHPQMSSWQNQLLEVGTLHAVEGADLASESAGLVTRIGFRSGEDVKRGVLLVQLRDDSEKAAADETMRTYKRDVALIKTKAISQADFDSAKANMLSTKAALEKKAIRAPFDGRVGIRKVDVGQYVAAGTTLVTLQQLDPIYVDFKATQQQLPQLVVGSKVKFTTDVLPGRTFVGQVVALDPKVNEDTRTVAVRAQVRNPGKVLLPGMFGSIVVDAGRPQGILTLPQTAITFNTYGNTVFVVKKQLDKAGKPELVAEQHFVITGETRGDQVAILSGVTTQDLVVSAGASKLKNGSILTVDNRIILPNDPNPHPRESAE
jgi:membrane fusion protein, multidrug efflux system